MALPNVMWVMIAVFLMENAPFKKVLSGQEKPTRKKSIADPTPHNKGPTFEMPNKKAACFLVKTENKPLFRTTRAGYRLFLLLFFGIFAPTANRDINGTGPLRRTTTGNPGGKTPGVFSYSGGNISPYTIQKLWVAPRPTRAVPGGGGTGEAAKKGGEQPIEGKPVGRAPPR